MTSKSTVFLIDDDESLREALEWLLESVEVPVETFASAREFLDAYDAGRPGCIVLDIRMPEMGGRRAAAAAISEPAGEPRNGTRQ